MIQIQVDYRCNAVPLSDIIKNESIILNYTTPIENNKYNGCKRKVKIKKKFSLKGSK